MNSIVKQAVNYCLENLKTVEDQLSERGFTLDDWLSDPDIRFGKKKRKEEAEETSE